MFHIVSYVSYGMLHRGVSVECSLIYVIVNVWVAIMCVAIMSVAIMLLAISCRNKIMVFLAVVLAHEP